MGLWQWSQMVSTSLPHLVQSLGVTCVAAHRRHPLPPCGRGWRVPRASYGSATQDPLGLDIEGVDRLARGHEQAVALLATETHVGAALGQQDAADHRAVGRED